MVGSWPTGPVVVPGNRLSVVFQSATDYGNRNEDVKFGLRATVTGHKPVSVLAHSVPLLSLECELAYALGVCLSQALCAGAASDKRKQDAAKEADSGALRSADVPGCV